MSRLEIEYALPVTALHFTGAVTIMTDTALDGAPKRIPSGTVATTVVAGRQRLPLKLSGGILTDTSAAFALTDDGRLTSAEVTRTGQGGKVILGVASAAASIAGAVFGGPAGAAVAFAANLQPVARAAEGAGETETDADRILDRYTKDHEDEATLLKSYRQAVRQAAIEYGAAAQAALEAQDDSTRSAALAKMRFLKQMLVWLRAELEPLETHFSAWRAGTIIQHKEQHDSFVTLDTLREVNAKITDGEIPFVGSSEITEVKRAWEGAGLAVVVDPIGKSQDVAVPRDEDSIIVREPRVVTLSVYERDEQGRARLQRTIEQLVIDSASPWRSIKLDRSWFAKRSNTLRFSELGALSGISNERGASTAALAETLASVPSQISGGLDQALAIRTKWGDLHSLGAEQQLAETKRAVELAQAGLTQAGLAATAGRYAELERLKQQAEILTQRKAIGDAALDDAARQLTTLKQQVETLKEQTALSEAR